MDKIIPMTIALLGPPGLVTLWRKTDKVGKGLYNGPGGKVESGESIDEATVREVAEETGAIVDTKDFIRSAVVDCHNWTGDGQPYTCRLFVSRVKRWTGTPRDSAELTGMRVFSRKELPLKEMLAGDAFWMPQVLTGNRIRIQVHYLPGMRALDKSKTQRITILTAEELDSLWVLP